MKASDSVENRIPDLSSSESICKDPSTTNAPLNEIRSNEVNQYLSQSCAKTIEISITCTGNQNLHILRYCICP